MALEPDWEEVKDRLYRITELADGLKKTPSIPLDIGSMKRIAKAGREIEEHSRRVTKMLRLST